VFPFLDWFHGYTIGRFRLDVVGGLTVALVLVPQSMAYAQLAGLPAYYGLYASFLPPMIAALFGSSRQLATGPVAIVSLMTATALSPLATTGSSQYIAYAILLALLVGVFQLLLGLLRLGLVVNFLSHPVIIGFTNAAALIIATSQLSKFFGVTIDNAEHHYETLYNVVKAAGHYTHLPTLMLGLLAIAIMVVLRRINRRIPNVLVAVIVTTVISWAIGFEKSVVSDLDHISDPIAQEMVPDYCDTVRELEQALEERVELREQYELSADSTGARSMQTIKLRQELELLGVDIEHREEDVRNLRFELRGRLFSAIEGDDGQLWFRSKDSTPEGSTDDGGTWRIVVGNKELDPNALKMTGGGAVVGNIPRGLPSFTLPEAKTSAVIRLFPMAMIISLLGFMEAISIAKAMAARTGQRLDPNQELIGQGLANIVGSTGQSYAVSGSFSRSAVNLQAGAWSGLSSVISSMVVVIVLLFLTPLLYHLPQSVLASIIMMAVISLIGVKAFVHAWRAHRHDGIVAIVSFGCTLVLAPHLDRGISIGVVLSLLFYMIRNMKPALALLSLHPDRTYRDRKRFDLSQCRHIAVIRYGGSLFFANVSYLERNVLETVRSMPELRHVVIVGNGMNEIDASGVDTLETILERLRGRGLRVSFSGLNDRVIETLRRSGLLAMIGEENLYRNAERTIDAIWEAAHEGSDERECPLKMVPTVRIPVIEEAQHGIPEDWLQSRSRREGEPPPTSGGSQSDEE
jgi:MFS superfamily sulfate permease-like transporter